MMMQTTTLRFLPTTKQIRYVSSWNVRVQPTQRCNINGTYCQTRQQLQKSQPSAPIAIVKRWSSNSTDNNNNSSNNSDQTSSSPQLIYKAPMGDLITRLKRISITSCLISVVGLPALVYLKNGTWPDLKQLGLGGFAFVSAGGSTLALHFVFGPYVMELYQIPKQDNHNNNVDDDDDDDDNQQSTPSPISIQTSIDMTQTPQSYMIKATKRSIFGLQQEIIFDPLHVTPYVGSRPFANFVVHNNNNNNNINNNNSTVLYCHPELLPEHVRLSLLHSNSKTKATTTSTTTKKKKEEEDDELF